MADETIPQLFELRNPVCPECGTEFVPRDSRQKTCSRECGVKLYAISPGRRAQGRAKYQKNREKIRAEANRKYAEDPETRQKYVGYMRKRREENPEQVRAINAKNRAKPENRVAATELSRDWRQEMRANQPWRLTLQAARKRAKARGAPFDLTDEWAKARWTGCCEVSGLPFTYGPLQAWSSPSLDQIVPQGGYTQDNARFVLWCVNAFKGQYSDAEVFCVAAAIVMKNKIPITA